MNHKSNEEIATTGKGIQELLTALGYTDDAQRIEARHSIVSLHRSAVPYLVKVLIEAPELARWEAAKALAEIRDPRAVPALILALSDSATDVSWAAADALIALGEKTLAPLLQALKEHSGSIQLRKSGRRILKILDIECGLDAEISPVIAALDGAEPELTVPIAAQCALEALFQSRRGQIQPWLTAS